MTAIRSVVSGSGAASCAGRVACASRGPSTALLTELRGPNLDLAPLTPPLRWYCSVFLSSHRHRRHRQLLPPPPTTNAVTSSPSGGIFDTPHTATPQLFMAFVAASSGPRLTRSGAFAPTPRCRFSQARPWDRDEAPPRAGEAQPEGLSGVGLPS